MGRFECLYGEIVDSLFSLHLSFNFEDSVAMNLLTISLLIPKVLKDNFEIV